MFPNWVVGCAPKNEAGWKNVSTAGSNWSPLTGARQPSYVVTVGRLLPLKMGKLIVVPSGSGVPLTYHWMTPTCHPPKSLTSG